VSALRWKSASMRVMAVLSQESAGVAAGDVVAGMGELWLGFCFDRVFDISRSKLAPTVRTGLPVESPLMQKFCQFLVVSETYRLQIEIFESE
jgi:hypothetical protein